MMMAGNTSTLSFTRIAMLAALVSSLFQTVLAGVGDPSTITLTGAARVTLSPDLTTSQSYYISDEDKPCNEANSTNATRAVSDAPHHYHVPIGMPEEEEDDDSFQASESPIPSVAPSALRGKKNSSNKEPSADTKDLRERGTFAMEQGMHHLKHLKQLVHLLDGNMGSSQSNYQEGAQEEDAMTTKWRHIHAYAVESLKEAFDLFLQVKEAATSASEGLVAQEKLRQVREHLVELQSNALVPPAAIETSLRPARALRSGAIKM